MTRGRFITLEGGEGAGKSTQARLLSEALKERGIDVLLAREPGGTPGAEAIRRLLLDPPGQGWSARAEAMLFAAARADHVERALAPAIEAGRWVVCDRYLDSSRAYQGEAGALGDEAILALHRLGSGLLPDLTLLIEIDPAIARERVAARDGSALDAIGGRPAAYHERVASAFARMAEAEPARFARIDGNLGAEAVHAQIVRAVAPLMASA